MCFLSSSCSHSEVIDKETLEVIRRLDTWTGILEDKAPVYVRGGANEFKADCSGSMYWIFKKAGLPFPRTTSIKMWLGAGWPGTVITDKNERKFPYLQWFSWKSPHDHVSIVRYRDKKGTWYSHASWGKQKFIRAFMKDGSDPDRHVSGIKNPALVTK
jgi:hypothetical protein